jgi:hypothetical protein
MPTLRLLKNKPRGKRRGFPVCYTMMVLYRIVRDIGSGNRQLPNCLLFITPFYQLQNFAKIPTGQMAICLPFIFLIEKYLTHLLVRRFYYKHVELAANGLNFVCPVSNVYIAHSFVKLFHNKLFCRWLVSQLIQAPLRYDSSCPFA